MISRVVLLAVCTGFLIAPPAAHTEVTKRGGFSYVREERTIGLLATKTFAAKCPGRTRVLSGGAGSEADIGRSFISASYPFDGADSGKDPDNGWKTRVSSFDEGFEVVVFAVCSRSRPVYRTMKEEAGSRGQASDPIPCPGKSSVVHGGLKGPTSLRLVSNYPSDNPGGDAWRVVADNISDRTQSGTGYAVCSDDIAATYASSGSVPISAGGQGNASPDCPPQAPNAIGGGPVSFGQVGDLRLVRTFPDTLSFGEWVGTVDTHESPGSFTVWATCSPDL